MQTTAFWKRRFECAMTAVALLAATGAAHATDGYFSHGYGMKAKGMGGAAATSTDDAFAGANNPATAAFAERRIEAGVEFFSPSRGEASYQGTGNAVSQESDSRNFMIPELGYSSGYDNGRAFGVTVYGNGGMNTDYGTNVFNGTGRLGVNLVQLIVAPTWAIRLDDKSSVGVSPLLVYQQFSANGLSGFAMMSSNSNALTNNGNAKSSGLGVRLGYYRQLNDQLSIGASYSPRTKMGKFDSYAGLFANGGGFDIPENYVLGLSIKPRNDVRVAFDYQRINYAAVNAIGNPSSSAGSLGADNGKGFGWANVDVLKLGVEWRHSEALTLRAGYNQSKNPIGSADVTFNVLAPGVVTKHYTLGATYALDKSREVTAFYMQAPSNAVTGTNMNGSSYGTDTIWMKQQSFGVQMSWKN